MLKQQKRRDPWAGKPLRLNIFLPTQFFFVILSPSVLQEHCRLRTARKPTKGSTSAWPPTPRACATPPPPTYMCEVRPEHVCTHTQRQPRRRHYSLGALSIKKLFLFYTCALKRVLLTHPLSTIYVDCCLVFLTTTLNKSTLNLGARSRHSRIKLNVNVGITPWFNCMEASLLCLLKWFCVQEAD